MEGKATETREAGRAVLIGRLVTSTCASAQIVKIDAEKARLVDGVAAVLLAEDFAEGGETLLAKETIEYFGQPLALIVVESEGAGREAEAALNIELHSSPGVVSVKHAEALARHHGAARTIRRGDAEKALAGAKHSIEGKVTIASQVPFGRETLCAEAWPEGNRASLRARGTATGLRVAVTAEAPSRVRSSVAAAIGVAESHVQVEALPLSDLCGGKENEAGAVAALASVAALKIGRPVRLQLTRAQDSAFCGGRAEVEADFKAGFDDSGVIQGIKLDFAIDGGWMLNDAETVRDRVLLHADGAYFVSDFLASCRLCRTNRVTTAAMPAEGAAQSSLVMEDIISRIAHRLGLATEEVRSRNLYRASEDRVVTPCGQKVEVGRLDNAWQQVIRESDLVERRREIEKWNAANPCYKRGIGIVPVKLGVGDPRSNRNQTTVVTHLLVDGSVTVQLGIAPAGDGMNGHVRRLVSEVLGIPEGKVAVHRGDLDAIAHSTVAHAVDAAGLIQQAVAASCEELRQRLLPVASQLLAADGGAEIDDDAIRFEDEKMWAGGRSVELAQVVNSAWRKRIGLSVVGHHRTPKLWWDAEVGGGWPFEYFALGAAVVEVQLDAFTGEVQLLRADLSLDLGDGAGPVDCGQAALIARAFQMGCGWHFHETLKISDDGVFLNAEAGSYLTPGFSDAALDFRLHGSTAEEMASSENARPQTAVEAPFVLAIAAREGLREAIRAFGAGPEVEVELAVPAIPEAVLAALRDLSKRVAAANRAAAAEKSEQEKVATAAAAAAAAAGAGTEAAAAKAAAVKPKTSETKVEKPTGQRDKDKAEPKNESQQEEQKPSADPKQDKEKAVAESKPAEESKAAVKAQPKAIVKSTTESKPAVIVKSKKGDSSPTVMVTPKVKAQLLVRSKPKVASEPVVKVKPGADKKSPDKSDKPKTDADADGEESDATDKDKAGDE